jgi:4-hydroxy-3-methylbut-2-enyl diphosphate reductase
VERAIAMAYEARQQFPDQKIHITNEIIHNPEVRERTLMLLYFRCFLFLS